MRRRRQWVEQARGRADVDREVETGERAAEGGTFRRRQAREAWRVGHAIARALNVTPWEALLGEVRRTAGAVAFLDRKVAEAPSDDALLRSGVDEATGERGYRDWLRLRMEERKHLAYVSKLAVDAGVARELVAQFTLQGEVVAHLLTNMVQGLASRGLGLTAEQESLLDDLLGRELLALEATASEDRTVSGEVVEVRRPGV